MDKVFFEDYKEAVKWFRKAAEQGHKLTHNSNLAKDMYRYGQGVLQKITKKQSSGLGWQQNV